MASSLLSLRPDSYFPTSHSEVASANPGLRSVLNSKPQQRRPSLPHLRLRGPGGKKEVLPVSISPPQPLTADLIGDSIEEAISNTGLKAGSQTHTSNWCISIFFCGHFPFLMDSNKHFTVIFLVILPGIII